MGAVFPQVGAGRGSEGDNRCVDLPREEFEELVAVALDRVPPELLLALDDVVVLVEDEPPPGEADLLGLYEGTPLTGRDAGWWGVLPDRITLFRNPLLRACSDREELAEEVRLTVLHEIGHHLGLSEGRLRELGLG